MSKLRSVSCRLLIVKWEFRCERFFYSLNINIDNSSISSARIEAFTSVRENCLVQEIQALESFKTPRTNSWLSNQCSLHADLPLASTPRPALRFNPLKPELNPICYLLALLAHNFLHVSRIRVKSLTFRRLMSYIYIYMEHSFLMFLDHTQRRSTVGRTPLDE